MAPACILLSRTVVFRNHPQEPSVEEEEGGAEGVVVVTTAAVPKVPEKPLSREATEAAVARYLRAMKPDLQVDEPPTVSYLTMVRPLSSDPIPRYGMDTCYVAAADKNLVLLYAGSYRPAYSYKGWHLLFDAASSSLSTIPGIPYGSFGSYKNAGFGTVILAREGGAFVLAELLFRLPRPGQTAMGLLYLWQSSCSSEQKSEWVYRSGQLPAEVLHTWRVHTSFPVQSGSRSFFCWVDLLHGLLLCDLGLHCEEAMDPLENDLGMSFVPLPHGCSITKETNRSSNPRFFRHAACIDGTIKFLTLDGFVEGSPISLVTYTLDLDDTSPRWVKDTVLRCEDIWADEKFISMDVPRSTPLFPILSTQEHDVVYLVLPDDTELVEGFRFRGLRLLLSVDMRKTRVISAIRPKRQTRSYLSWHYLLACNASQWSSKDHQVLHTITAICLFSFVNSKLRRCYELLMISCELFLFVYIQLE